MKVVILGAGSTIGTLGGSLGVQGLAQRLEQVHGPTWRARYPRLAEAVEHCGSSNLDRIWTHVDYAAKLTRSVCQAPDCPKLDGACPRAGPDCQGPDYGGVSGELRRALLAAYALRHELEELLMKRAGGTLMGLLTDLQPGDVLISFNWDTVGERILREKCAAPVATARRPPLGSTTVHLVKPHGSLSWEDHGGRAPVRWCESGSRAPLFEAMQMGSNNYPQPLVLGALPIKDELIAGTQVMGGNGEIFALIADQWASVVYAVEHADYLVLVGYGFPPEDTYGRFLFRQAAARRGARPRPSIEYYALARDRARIVEAVRETFGSDVNCTYAGCVEPPLPKP